MIPPHLGLYHSCMGSSTAWSRSIATQVSAAIQQQGISIRQAADRAGIPRETLRRRLADNSSAFTVDELEDLAAVLDVDAGQFLDPNQGGQAS